MCTGKYGSNENVSAGNAPIAIMPAPSTVRRQRSLTAEASMKRARDFHDAALAVGEQLLPELVCYRIIIGNPY